MWLQLWYDMEIASEAEEAEQPPQWKKKGESAAEARDRLKREREAAKKQLGIS